MALPDTSDEAKMIHIGKMTVLRKARREAGKKLRDRLVPVLNALENEGSVWDVSGIAELVEQINEINKAIEELN